MLFLHSRHSAHAARWRCKTTALPSVTGSFAFCWSFHTAALSCRTLSFKNFPSGKSAYNVYIINCVGFYFYFYFCYFAVFSYNFGKSLSLLMANGIAFYNKFILRLCYVDFSSKTEVWKNSWRYIINSDFCIYDCGTTTCNFTNWRKRNKISFYRFRPGRKIKNNFLPCLKFWNISFCNFNVCSQITCVYQSSYRILASR